MIIMGEAAMAEEGVHQRPGPPYLRVVAGGLLDVDVLAVQAAVNRQKRVPMVRRGDQEDVHRPVVEEGAVVIDQIGHVPRLLLHLRAVLLADGLIRPNPSVRRWVEERRRNFL
jgi:hypothetical protein